MKRGPLVLGALASGLVVAYGKPAFAEDFFPNDSFIQAADAHKNVAYLTALSIKKPSASMAPLAVDLTVKPPGKVPEPKSVLGIIALVDADDVRVYFSQSNAVQIGRFIQSGSTANKIPVAGLGKLASTTISGTYLAYRYNAGDWVTATGSFEFGPTPQATVDAPPTTLDHSTATLYRAIFQRD
jgi:hypothetical protein